MADQIRSLYGQCAEEKLNICVFLEFCLIAFYELMIAEKLELLKELENMNINAEKSYLFRYQYLLCSLPSHPEAKYRRLVH